MISADRVSTVFLRFFPLVSVKLRMVCACIVVFANEIVTVEEQTGLGISQVLDVQQELSDTFLQAYRDI